MRDNYTFYSGGWLSKPSPSAATCMSNICGAASNTSSFTCDSTTASATPGANRQAYGLVEHRTPTFGNRAVHAAREILHSFAACGQVGVTFT